MRNRTLTPYFRLPADERTPPVEPRVPRRVLRSARSLEGRAISRGRYLLLQLLCHTRNTATFSARDQHSGLELEVEVAFDTDTPRGYRVLSTTLPERPSLPNLYTPPITLEHRISSHHRYLRHLGGRPQKKR
ncbi:MAG: hypothetical protein JRH20_17165 [Deltaproteobacteria bacterium]|nr:hypothetical protein [Deltaproteobacteria bacterium]